MFDLLKLILKKEEFALALSGVDSFESSFYETFSCSACDGACQGGCQGDCYGACSDGGAGEKTF